VRLFIPLSPLAQRVAEDMARLGIEPVDGAPLPALLPTDLEREIQIHLSAFRLAWHMAQLHKGDRHGHARLV
jgi:hypothetical protein